MPFCSKCGAEYTEGAKKCPKCGVDLKSHEATGFEKTIRKINDTADTSADYDKADIENNKAFAILSYIGPLVLIPIFAAKDSKFARYHANQGLVLLIFDIVMSVLVSVVGAVFGAIALGFIAALFASLCSLCCVALMIIGIINVANDKAKELPIIGKIKLIS